MIHLKILMAQGTLNMPTSCHIFFHLTWSTIYRSPWPTRPCSIWSLLTSLTPSPATISLTHFVPATLTPLSGTFLKEKNKCMDHKVSMTLWK